MSPVEMPNLEATDPSGPSGLEPRTLPGALVQRDGGAYGLRARGSCELSALSHPRPISQTLGDLGGGGGAEARGVWVRTHLRVPTGPEHRTHTLENSFPPVGNQAACPHLGWL